ncbi:MAG: calcium-binding EGF-like domain-containing protein [Bacteroidota bacterium]
MQSSLIVRSLFVCLCLFLFAACEERPCEEVNCVNGSCDEVTGECVCQEGFEGSLCETSIRQKFLGTYDVSYEGCFSTTPNHTVGIEQDPTAANQVLVKDLGDYACPEGEGRVILTAVIEGDQLTLAQQSVDCGQIIYNFLGNGRINEGVLTLDFWVNYDSDGIEREDRCTATLQKR